MDSFRGNIPPTFISFRLENQTPETETLPVSSATLYPTTSEAVDPDQKTLLDTLIRFVVQAVNQMSTLTPRLWFRAWSLRDF